MEHFIQQFLQPPRPVASTYDLGPLVFKIEQEVISRQEHNIQGIPFSFYNSSKNNPTILYVHTYNSNRLQVKSIIKHLLKKRFNVASIQLQRIGFQDKYRSPKVDKNGIITFGYYEYEQIHHVMRWIKNNINDKVILWGRSMGAVCSIRYQKFYGDAEQLVLDSPFHNLIQLFSTKLYDLTILSSFLAKSSVNIMKQSLSEKLHFNIEDLSIQKDINFTTPVTLLFNQNDSVSNKSSQLLYEKCRGKKQIYYLNASHEGERDSTIIRAVVNKLAEKYMHNGKKLRKINLGKSNSIYKTKIKPLILADTTVEIEQEQQIKRIFSLNSEKGKNLLETSCLF